VKKNTTNNKSAPGKITYKHDFLLFESAKTVCFKTQIQG